MSSYSTHLRSWQVKSGVLFSETSKHSVCESPGLELRNTALEDSDYSKDEAWDRCSADPWGKFARHCTVESECTLDLQCLALNLWPSQLPYLFPALRDFCMGLVQDRHKHSCTHMSEHTFTCILYRRSWYYQMLLHIHPKSLELLMTMLEFCFFAHWIDFFIFLFLSWTSYVH